MALQHVTDDAMPEISLAFELAPVGLCVSRDRVIARCNEAFAQMFGYSVPELMGQSLRFLYPSMNEYENTGERGSAELKRTGLYNDDRIMRHRDGSLFWCHVSGRTKDRDHPFSWAVWIFEDISVRRPVTARLTIREREIARELVVGKSSKQIARALQISPRTVEAHRVRISRKVGARSAGELISRLVGLI